MGAELRSIDGGKFDPWATDDGKPKAANRQGLTRGVNYDPSAFYVRSVNKHDHSETTRVRVPADVLAEAYALVAKDNIPEYRTFSDLVRDAIVHRLHFLAENMENEELLRWVEREMRQARLEQAARERDALQKLVATHEAAIKSGQDDNDVWGLEKEREMLADDVEWVREPYKGQLKKLLDRMG